MARALMAADRTATHEPIESRLETEAYDVILAADGTSIVATAREQEIGGPTGSEDSGIDASAAHPFGPRGPAGVGRAVPPWIVI
jgi:hypothetical protein